MAYHATLYFTGGRTESVEVEADNRNEAHDKLKQRKELAGWECYTLEKVSKNGMYNSAIRFSTEPDHN